MGDQLRPRTSAAQAGKTYGNAARSLGRGLRSLKELPGKVYTGAKQAAGGALDLAGESIRDATRPFVQGLAGVDADVNEQDTATPMPSVARRPRALAQPSAFEGPTYTDPNALATLSGRVPGTTMAELEPPPTPEPPPAPVAGNLRSGQSLVSGGMRRIPPKNEYSDEYLQSLNPESFAEYMGRRKAIAGVETDEAAARSPQETADLLGAAQDMTDYDTEYRAPRRQASLLALEQQKFEHPVSQAQRAEAQRQSYLRYGLPQQIAGEYDLSRQGLVNEGLIDRTEREQYGLAARDQSETERTRLKADADTQSAAMRALSGMETKRIDPYSATPYQSPYEEDFTDRAFPQRGAAAEGTSLDSPEQVAEAIKQRYPDFSPADYPRVLSWLEQNNHISGLTDGDRQRILAALGAR